jgi:hypothetical protein
MATKAAEAVLKNYSVPAKVYENFCSEAHQTPGIRVKSIIPPCDRPKRNQNFARVRLLVSPSSLDALALFLNQDQYAEVVET